MFVSQASDLKAFSAPKNSWPSSRATACVRCCAASTPSGPRSPWRLAQPGGCRGNAGETVGTPWENQGTPWGKIPWEKHGKTRGTMGKKYGKTRTGNNGRNREIVSILLHEKPVGSKTPRKKIRWVFYVPLSTGMIWRFGSFERRMTSPRNQCSWWIQGGAP